MMKPLFITTVTVVLLSVFSCKKKSTTPDPLPTSYGTSTTSDKYGALQTMIMQYYDGRTFLHQIAC